MAEQLLAALLVLALLGGTLWLLRRKGLASLNMTLPKRLTGTKQMQVVERMALTPHHSLHLVRVRGQTVLIAVSPSGCNRIAYVREFSAPQGLKDTDEAR